MKRLLLAAPIGALCFAAPLAAHADYLIDRCTNNAHDDWSLAFDTISGKAAFWNNRTADPARFGTYTSDGGWLAYLSLDKMNAALFPATSAVDPKVQGLLRFAVAAGKGSMDCWGESQTSVKPDRWPANDFVVAPAPVDNVPLYVTDNTMRLSVLAGGHRLTMILDTGATHGSMPPSFGERLLDEGAAVEGPHVTVTLADGSTHESRTIIVNLLTIGGHTAHDVRFGLEADGLDPLLGFDALSKFGKFSIDTNLNVLTFS
jgi:hypothetical protein